MNINKLVVGLLSVGFCCGCFAGEAVSGPNGKVDFSTGNMDGNSGNNFMGSFAFPLGTNFGFQVDALFTDVADRDFYGTGAHLFWRDSEKGFFGIVAGGVHEEYLESWAGGLEGELYLGDFTLGAQGGVANMDYDLGALPFFNTDQTEYYAIADVGFYPTDNLLLSLSHTRAFGNGMTQAQVEYQTPLAGVSLFADVGQGEYNYDHALVGIRYYFGAKEKSLKCRHRQDDPQNMLNAILYNVGTSSAEFGSKMEEFYRRLFDDSLRSGGGSFGAIGGSFGAIGGSGGSSWSSDRFSDTFSVDSDIIAIP